MNKELNNFQKIKDIIYNADGINIIFEENEEKEEDIVQQFPKIINKLDNNVNNDDIFKNMSIENMIDIIYIIHR